MPTLIEVKRGSNPDAAPPYCGAVVGVRGTRRSNVDSERTSPYVRERKQNEGR